MLRSMFAGVSGLQNHQTKMDVIGDNISNVNTTGFKSSRATFAEMFNQTLEGAAAPGDDLGGSNAVEVGLGTSLASIDRVDEQGSLQTTGQDTDMAIEGAGYFMVRDGDQSLYTRSGAFNTDGEGYLVTDGGQRLQGWRADSEGELPRTDAGNLEDLRISLGESLGAEATERVVFENNLWAGGDTDYGFTAPVEVFDSLGNEHTIEVEFAYEGGNEWELSVEGQSDAIEEISFENGDEISFSDDGTVEGEDDDDEVTRDITIVFEEGEDMDVTLDLSAITQYSGSSTVSATERDGFPAGTLESFSIDSGGGITGVYDNGRSQRLGRVAVAAFSNPGGLESEGSGLYRESNNSGLRQVGSPDTGPRGSLEAGTLEMSNVDLSDQFTEMVITQRGFQANSRIITTSDELLEELTHLKR